MRNEFRERTILETIDGLENAHTEVAIVSAMAAIDVDRYRTVDSHSKDNGRDSAGGRFEHGPDSRPGVLAFTSVVASGNVPMDIRPARNVPIDVRPAEIRP